jgi:hypothetical protein
MRIQYETLIVGALNGAIEAHQLFGLPLDPESLAPTICNAVFRLAADCRAKMQAEVAEMIFTRCADPTPPEHLN